jgi:hypothetical protein
MLYFSWIFENVKNSATFSDQTGQEFSLNQFIGIHVTLDWPSKTGTWLVHFFPRDISQSFLHEILWKLINLGNFYQKMFKICHFFQQKLQFFNKKWQFFTNFLSKFAIFSKIFGSNSPHFSKTKIWYPPFLVYFLLFLLMSRLLFLHFPFIYFPSIIVETFSYNCSISDKDNYLGVLTQKGKLFRKYLSSIKHNRKIMVFETYHFKSFFIFEAWKWVRNPDSG